MNHMKYNFLNRIVFSISAAMIVVLISCSSENNTVPNKDVVVIHSMSEPEGLNPYTTSDAQASQIGYNLFQSLLRYDFETLELIPVLASALPEIVEEENGSSLTFQLIP